MSEGKDARVQESIFDVVKEAVANAEAVRLFELTTLRERVQLLYVST